MQSISTLVRLFSILLVTILTCLQSTYAQTVYNHTSGRINDVCSGKYYDSGGPNSPYVANENNTFTICAPTDSCLQIKFSEFDIEENFDVLFIFDGPTSAFPQIYGSPFTGKLTEENLALYASNGCLTFRFESDGSTTRPGWAADISCNCIKPTEQDCLGAIPVCQDKFVQRNSFIGTGNFRAEIDPDKSCLEIEGEQNSVWYRFTVQETGFLQFAIDPADNKDDYDFALYDLTNDPCDSIFTKQTLQKSCNFCPEEGVTGIMDTGTVHSQGAFLTCTNTNSRLNVTKGQTFVLYISNFSSTQSGYTLDFSTSTARIFDISAPIIAVIQNTPIECTDSIIVIELSEGVNCSTVTPSDFKLTGPNGTTHTISKVESNCLLGLENEKLYAISFSPPITLSGNYRFDIIGDFSGQCGNKAVQSFDFKIELFKPILSQVSTSCVGQCNGSASITNLGTTKLPISAFKWSNNATSQNISNLCAGKYTVTLTNSVGCSGIGEIEVLNPPPFTSTITSQNQPICEGQTIPLSGIIGGGANLATCSGGNGGVFSNVNALSTIYTPSAADIAAGSVTLHLDAGKGSCPTVRSSKTIVINKKPQLTVNPLNYTTCTGNPFTIPLTSNVVGSSFAWSIGEVTGNPSGQSAGNGDLISQILSSQGIGSVIYVVTPTGTAPTFCTGNPVNILVNISPTPEVSVQDITICSGGNTDRLVLSTTGDILNWTSASIPDITGNSNGSGTSVNQILINRSGAPIQVKYNISSSFEVAACSSDVKTVIVTVLPEAVLTIQNKDTSICSGTETAIELTANIANPVYTWNTVAVAGISGNINGFGNSIKQALINSTNTPIQIQYEVRISGEVGGGCSSEPKITFVKVLPSPTLFVDSDTICSGST